MLIVGQTISKDAADLAEVKGTSNPFYSELLEYIY